MTNNIVVESSGELRGISLEEVWGNIEIGVFYSSSEAVVFQLATSIRSLLDSNLEENTFEIMPKVSVGIFILHSGLTSETRDLLVAEFPELPITFLDASLAIPRLPLGAAYARESYFRLVAPALIPENRVGIFLDADTVVLQPIFSEVIDFSLKCIVSATIEPTIKEMVSSRIALPKTFGGLTTGDYLERVLMVRPEDYLQAGFLVFRGRQEDLRELSQKFISEVPNIYWLDDQSIINKVIKGRFHRLEEKWNYQVGRNLFSVPSNCKILHFSGVFRPWTYVFHPAFREFEKYGQRISQNLRSRRPRQQGLMRFTNTLGLLLYRFLPITWRGVYRRVLGR